ncbi:hypothetical protein MPSEU_000810100 [Mayamaea pseudoterrestris]|nr:hypothetical protein MPSEU_000810100 [Mayamaea pseudoterrestris]
MPAKQSIKKSAPTEGKEQCHNSHEPPREEQVELTETDVVFGRGLKIHRSNAKYYFFICNFKAVYRLIKEKSSVVEKVIQAVGMQDPPGRFLIPHFDREPPTKQGRRVNFRYYITPPSRVRIKVGQTLRERNTTFPTLSPADVDRLIGILSTLMSKESIVLSKLQLERSLADADAEMADRFQSDGKLLTGNKAGDKQSVRSSRNRLQLKAIASPNINQHELHDIVLEMMVSALDIDWIGHQTHSFTERDGKHPLGERASVSMYAESLSPPSQLEQWQSNDLSLLDRCSLFQTFKDDVLLDTYDDALETATTIDTFGGPPIHISSCNNTLFGHTDGAFGSLAHLQNCAYSTNTVLIPAVTQDIGSVPMDSESHYNSQEVWTICQRDSRNEIASHQEHLEAPLCIQNPELNLTSLY